MTSEQVELIRVRIMQEAYDLADRNDSEGYNSVKVMCSEVLKLIQLALSAEREACAAFLESGVDLAGLAGDPMMQAFTGKLLIGCAAAIRARGQA